MAVLIRVAAFLGFFAASRFTHKRAPLIVYEIDRLNWERKARLIWGLSRDRRVPAWTRLIVLVPALYLMSPIDLLPDFIPFLGRLDDIAVFQLSMDILTWFAPKGVVAQHLERIEK
jgi:uncharacterized membrane protein YkvA (DUF1232 family)